MGAHETYVGIIDGLVSKWLRNVTNRLISWGRGGGGVLS